MHEAELDGSAVLNWLKHVGHEAGGAILAGCLLDNQTDEVLLIIEGVDADHALRCRLGHVAKRVAPSVLSTAKVFDRRSGFPLAAAVHSLKSPAEIALEEARARLKASGIQPAKITRSDDVLILIAMIEDHAALRLPAPADQEARYAAIKRSDILALGAGIIDRWRIISQRDYGSVDGGLLIKLTYCLRHSGDLERALRMTESVVRSEPGVRLSPGQKSVLATERAAILLDLYELRRNRSLLSKARHSLDISWAISPSEEVSQVYRRLRSL